MKTKHNYKQNCSTQDSKGRKGAGTEVEKKGGGKGDYQGGVKPEIKSKSGVTPRSVFRNRDVIFTVWIFGDRLIVYKTHKDTHNGLT